MRITSPAPDRLLPPRRHAWWPPGRTAGGVLLLAVVAGATRLPFLARPLSPDEGGFLMVAAQWHPGTSLYGDYWVDRPPVLIGLFELAGGGVGLRVLGLVVVVAGVLLAGRLGHLLTRGSRAGTLAAAATAAVFLTSPLLGASEVNGELLASPFVLAGLVAALEAYAAPEHPSASGWWFVAGATGVTAALVKQDMVDVLVVVAALAVVQAVEHRGRAAVLRTAFALAGGLTVLVAVLTWAALRGTDPVPLWDALVTFRLEAAATIHAHAASTVPHRAVRLLLAVVASGTAFVVALLLWALTGRGRPTVPLGVRVVPVVLLTWEAVAIGGGGSHWLHYLVGAVPGLVTSVAAVAALTPRRVHSWVAAALTYAAAVSLVSLGWVGLAHAATPRDTAVKDYLEDHARPGDTGLVAFGNPSILQAAGLPSPYEELWSLPVRVRDPRLVELTRVLTGPHRPTWVAVSGDTLGTWGIDARRGETVLGRDYREVAVEGDYQVWLVDGR